MNIKPARNIFVLFVFCFAFLLFLPPSVYADTTTYRPAGWVSTGWYANTDGCQKTDGKYCEQPGGKGWKQLFFGSFGNMDDFGIPYGSTISAIRIRVTGHSSTAQYFGVDDAHNGYDGNHACSFPATWGFNLGAADSVGEIVTPTSGTSWPGPVDCVTESNIDQENLTFQLSANAYYGIDWWSAYIDNFEIAFDYAPPTTTYENPAPSDFNGTVWQWDNLSDHAVKIPGLNNVIAVAKGVNHALALKSDGTVWAWGSNSKGQFGMGNDSIGETISVPVQVKGANGEGFLKDVIAIDASSEYSLALKQDGTVWTWGNNHSGYRGTGIGLDDPVNNLVYPAQVKGQYGAGFLTGITAITAGEDDSFALKSDGTVWGWGGNDYGKLGNSCYYFPYYLNSCSNSLYPDIAVGLDNVKAVSAGRNHTLALKNDGTVWGWGDASGFQLGHAYRASWGAGERRTPGIISELSAVKAISVKGYYSMAVNNASQVIDWPSGDPRIIPETQSISEISSGSLLGTALKDDGTVWQYWSINTNPVKIKNLSQVSALSAGSPSLAVVGKANADTPPAPFLDLPFDYKSMGETFKEVVLNPGSWFDHKYPLQNVDCCEPDIIQYTGLPEKLYYHSHSGYDYNKKNGVFYRTPVLAAYSGTATLTLEKNSGGAGNVIKIDHHNGYQTWYEHLSPTGMIVPDENTRIEVKQGQKIGEIGFSGNAIPHNEDGAHIHLSVFKDIKGNNNFDDDWPYGLVDPLGWEGSESDPWTEWPNKDAEIRGAKSYYLFTTSINPKTTPIPQEGGKLNSDDNKTEIDVPKDATNSAFNLSFKAGPFESFESIGKTFESIVPSFFLDAINGAGEKITKFNDSFKIIIKYDGPNVLLIKESTLTLYFFDEFLQEWTPLPSIVDTVNKTVTAFTPHNSHFALLGEVKDKIPPTTTVVIHGNIGKEKWYRSDVIIELNGTDNEDGMGLRHTLYSFDNEKWNEYNSPFKIDTEGNYKIFYESSDNAYNNEDVKIVELDIDRAPPTASASAERTPDANDWYNHLITISFSGQDDGSGIDKCTFPIEYKEHDNANAIVEGNCSDKAGNVATASSQFKYDSTPPILTATASAKGKPYISGSWTNGDVQVMFTCADKTSGVDTVSVPVTVNTEGKNQSVSGSCTDKAGNKSEISFNGVNIDKTAPEAKIIYDLSSFDSIVSGKDNLGTTTVAIDKTKILQLKYTISDQAGNKLVVNTDKIKIGKQVALTIKNLQYNNNPVIFLDPNVFFTLALTDAKNTVKQLDQYYTLKDDKKIFSSYSLSNNTTKIYAKSPGSTSYTQENKPGITLLNLETELGKLKYSY